MVPRTNVHDVPLDDVTSEIEGRLALIRAREERPKKHKPKPEASIDVVSVEAQIKAGRCEIVPLPIVATQPFRVELAIEQSSVFVANAYKGDFFEREWEVPNPSGSGEPVLRKLVVGKVHEKGRARGVLKQVHQDLFYHLLDLWGKDGLKVIKDDKGNARGVLNLSGYQLVKKARHSNGSDHYKRVRELLQDLSSIPIVLSNAYTWQGLRDLAQFTLLDGVSWNERSTRDTETAEVSILFSARITEGFLHQHVKVLLGQPYWCLREVDGTKPNETARLLYPFLDSQLATKTEYNIRLDALAERFGMARYQRKSQRLNKILPAIQLLDGKLILNEQCVLRTSVRLSSDGKDYVLIATRTPK